MRRKKAMIDSLNLSGNHIEAIFIHKKEYSIETVKSKSRFDPNRWRTIFGEKLKQNIIEAKIIHSYLGSILPLKTFAVSPLRQTLEFAGLHSYNERSKLLVQTLRELKSQLDYTRVMRIDVAIDFEGEIPKTIIKALSTIRDPFQWYNTTYWKTKKEKRSNSYMDIKIYDKSLKEDLDYPLKRLEFCFKGDYFKKLILKDLSLAKKKMEKSIKKAICLTVRIEDIF